MKKILTILHQILGLSLGLVLAIMGVSGALYACQEDIIQHLHPASTRVAVNAAARLTPAQLQLRLQTPQQELTSLAWSDDPAQAARAGILHKTDAGTQFEMRYLNPYTAELLPQPASENFFKWILKLHRQLTWGKYGKTLTGLASLALLLMSISGLILRWPSTRKTAWRSWLGIDWQLRGRAFWGQFHAALGTGLLLVYLLSALTALCWSYESVGHTVRALAGSPLKEPRLQSSGALDTAHLTQIWQTFSDTVPDYQKLTLVLPASSDGTVQFYYLPKHAAHAYAYDQLSYDAGSGRLLQERHYRQQSNAQQLLSSLYALHSGHYWGGVGALLMALSSLSLALMFGSGAWMFCRKRLPAARI